MDKANVLHKILAHKALEVAKNKMERPLATLKDQLKDLPPPRNFTQAIQKHHPAIIAEIKKASPSKGLIREDFDPVAIAKDYEEAGATCLSVLTDEKFFQGSTEYFKQARQACELPMLRKDFIINAYQIYESRLMGADCILLIVAALSQTQLIELSELAESLSLSVLVEVHTQEELKRALALPNPMVGINNRDLTRFETTIKTTLNLLPHIPNNRIVITESGIKNHHDVEQLIQAGVHGFLIGEAFMRENKPGGKLKELFF